jgi:hypothetical protein
LFKRTFPSKRSAEAFRDRLLIDRAGFGEYNQAELPTITEAQERYIEDARERQLAQRTIDYYDELAVMFERHIGGTTEIDLVQEDVAEYIRARRKAGSGEARILKELNHLRRITSHAGITPRWTVPDLRPTRRVRHIYRDTETARLYLSLGDPRVERGMLLALLTAMRPKEVLHAHSSWIHLESREIQIPAEMSETERTKTRVTNRLPLVPMLWDALEGVDGKLVDIKIPALRSLLRRRSHRIKLEPECTGFESFRHTAPTWVVEAGWTHEQADLLLSHLPLRSTAARWYTRLAQIIEPKREMLLAVEGRFQSAIEQVRGE